MTTTESHLTSGKAESTIDTPEFRELLQWLFDSKDHMWAYEGHRERFIAHIEAWGAKGKEEAKGWREESGNWMRRSESHYATISMLNARLAAAEADRDHFKAIAERQAPDIADMVNRFLGWKMPKDFYPDCGITFKHNETWGPYPNAWPVGTNLFTADQAKAMFEYCLLSPAQQEPAKGCSKCGSTEIHACPGAPIPPWTPEKIAELHAVLAEYEPEPKAASATDALFLGVDMASGPDETREFIVTQATPEGGYSYQVHGIKISSSHPIQAEAIKAAEESLEQAIPGSTNDDDPAEAAFWNFDARKKGYAEWKGRPQSERDAFKAEYRAALGGGPKPMGKSSETRMDTGFEGGSGLPPLPDADHVIHVTDSETMECFRADQMRDYARAALAAPSQQPQCEDCGDSIVAHDPGVCGNCYAMKYRDAPQQKPAATGGTTIWRANMLHDQAGSLADACPCGGTGTAFGKRCECGKGAPA